MTQSVEARHAVLIAGYRFTIEDNRTRTQAGQCLDDQWEAVGQVVAGPAIEPNASAVLTRDDPEAVVLDLMEPYLARRRSRRLGGQAWRNETRRQRHSSAL